MVDLNVSIDLDAELEKITRKQYLNHVHYLIQLVRHALTHHPSRIDIRTEGKRVFLSQDGDPFNSREWLLLQTLTGEISEQERQSALVELENKYGIAMLSILLNFPIVFIGGPTGTVSSQKGTIDWGGRSKEVVAGYVMELEHPEADRSEELGELTFYAGGSSTPITYNGVRINKPIELEHQILVTRFENSHGAGVVGLPMDSELCHITIYKQGVRVGMKQFMPGNGRTYHAWWNSRIDTFEGQYKKTIGHADSYIEQYSRRLYSELPRFFDELSDSQKERSKKIVLGLERKHWEKGYRKVPFFDSTHRPFALSLADLEVLEQRYEGIPFLSLPNEAVPPYIPRLGAEDIFFLKNTAGKNLKLVTPGKRPSKIKPGEEPLTVIDERELGPDQVRFLSRLQAMDPLCSFRFTKEPLCMTTEPNGRRKVFLQADHPMVLNALRAYRKQPGSASLWKYRLIDEAIRSGS